MQPEAIPSHTSPTSQHHSSLVQLAPRGAREASKWTSRGHVCVGCLAWAAWRGSRSYRVSVREPALAQFLTTGPVGQTHTCSTQL